MAEPRSEGDIRRIVIALDAVCDNLAALDAAVNLAARWNAEVIGLFLEDERLHRAAALPFVRQVRFPAGPEPFERERLEAELIALAGRARRALERLATRSNVSWSFQTVRGDIGGLAVSIGDADLLVIEDTSRPFAGHLRLESLLRQTVLQGRQPVLLARPGQPPAKPLAILHDGSEAADRAMATAARLVGDASEAVIVLATANLEAGIGDRLRALGIRGEFRRVDALEADTLRPALRQAKAGLCVVAAGIGLPGGQTLDDLIGRLPCAVLLVP